jgi:spore germination protein YaaH
MITKIKYVIKHLVKFIKSQKIIMGTEKGVINIYIIEE